MMNYIFENDSYNPWENLAIEKHLADRIQPGDLLLYLWQNENTVVIGRNQNALRECRAKLLEEEGGFLARRTTGGGAVYQDLGNLCFTFVASPERYDLERQMKVIGIACRKFGIETEFSGRNDIVTKDGYKFSGNAFSVTSKCKIQHGTIMIHVDTEKLKRYLTPSKEKMMAKGVKSVQSRVCNLKDLNPKVTVEAMKKALREAFEEEYGAATILLSEDLDGSEIQKTYEKYASWDWKYGKSPECETICSKRFAWGEVELHLKLKNLYVEECVIFSDTLDVDFPNLLKSVIINQRFDMKDVDVKSLTGITENQREQIQEVLTWLSEM